MPKPFALRRGVGAALIVAGAAAPLTACEQEPPKDVLPPMVQVELEAGRILLNGCFDLTTDRHDNGGDIGTLALAQATNINNEPITFAFTKLGTHKTETLDQDDLENLVAYSPEEGGEWHTVQEGQPETAHCTQVITNRQLAAEYDGRFAQVRYRRIEPFALYGPYDQNSRIDNACGPVTPINDRLYAMSEISLANQGPKLEIPLAPQDCQREVDSPF